MLKKINKLFLVILILISIYLLKTTFAQTYPPPTADPKELMEQGKIRSCLKAKFVSGTPKEGESSGSKRITTIHLTGQCLAPGGCICVMSWGLNSAVANKDEFESCSTNEEDIKKSFTFQDLLKFAKLNKDPDMVARNRAVHCGHGRADLKNEFLANLKPGSRICTIIKNNLSQVSVNNNNNNNQVLGTETNGYLPYGPVDVLVQEETYRHTPNDFVAVGDLPPDISSTELKTGGIEPGNQKTQKLGIVTFTSKDFNQSSDDLKTNCVSISWDPYGRVFDAQTLEPISDTHVTLIDATTKKPVIQKYNFNDDVTGDDGLFNIQVEKEGMYQLLIEPSTNHQFISNPKLSLYWSKIYSDLYFPNSVFQEKAGVPTHHDIPLQSVGEPYHGAIARVVEGTLKSENMGNWIVFRGRETFPFANVCLVDDKSGKQVGQCVHANNIGNFTIVVDKKDVPSNKLIIKVQKVDLNNPDLYKEGNQVETLNSISLPEEKTAKIYYYEPILSYIEGYAIDNNGEKIPKAIIFVRLSSNNQVFYQTKADDRGFFKIYTKNLPYIEYYLEFIDSTTGKRIIQTTSEFVTKNKAYLDSEKINLMTTTKYNQSTLDQKAEQFDLINKTKNLISSKNNIEQNSGLKSAVIMIFLVFIIIILVTVGIVVIYVKKKQERGLF